MMMASESTSRPELSAEAVRALHAAIQGYLVDEREIEPLEAALRLVAAECREKQILAEQLLLTLKDIWYGLPAVDRSAADPHNRMLQRVVSLCIRAYYST
jgi:hypothetical protein